MTYLEQIQRGVDYIETHLGEPIELPCVSKVAGLSHWHFQRIFKALTGETLKTYVRSRRLARSLDALLTTDRRIIEVAIEAGFESQEAFTRAFKRSFGITPHRYRKLGERSSFLKKVRLDSAYLQHLEHNVSRAPRLDDRGPVRLVGRRTRFFGVDSDKNNIASQIPALWAAFLPRMMAVTGRVPGCGYGAIRPTRDDSDLLEYYASVEVARGVPVDPDMVALEVPAATYATFEHRGRIEGLDRTVNYVYSTWLLQSGMRHTGGPDLEIYGAGYEVDSDDSVIGYAIPVRPA